MSNLALKWADVISKSIHKFVDAFNYANHFLNHKADVFLFELIAHLAYGSLPIARIISEIYYIVTSEELI